MDMGNQLKEFKFPFFFSIDSFSFGFGYNVIFGCEEVKKLVLPTCVTTDNEM